MQKRSKIKGIIKPDLKVSMKEARIERKRVKMLKPQLLSEKKCLEKRQNVVEEIFEDVDVKNDEFIQKNTHQQNNHYHQTMKKKRFLQT